MAQLPRGFCLTDVEPDANMIPVGITFLATVLVPLLAACVAAPPDESVAVTVAAERLAVEPASYGSLVWADNDTVVIDWYPPDLPDGRSQGGRLVALDLDATEHRALPHEVSNADCDFIEDLSPGRLVDDRIAFVRLCHIYMAPTEPTDIVALDLESSQQERVAALGDPLVGEGWRAGIYEFSVRPGTDEGVVGFGARICDGIARFDAAGVRPFDFALSDPDGANLADMWNLDCTLAVNASRPAWSPDGTSLAVLIARDARGRDGWDRMDAPFALDLLDPATGSVTNLATGLHDAFRLAWSPDGGTIAVITGTDMADVNLTWLISTRGGPTRRLVLDDGRSLNDVAWSPDGTRLAGLLNGTDPDAIPSLFEPVVITLPPMD